jgi:hypothetical protein
VNDIAKGVLGGGWSLVAGWILPTAINVLLAWFFVLPSLHELSPITTLSRATAGEQSLAVLSAAVIIGLTLSALQTRLYRVLEGYWLWPLGIASKRQGSQLKAKKRLEKRVEAIEAQQPRTLKSIKPDTDIECAAPSTTDPRIERLIQRDRKRTPVQQALLRERLRRYPVYDAQIAPTRLGNAIRRLEEYGYQRYRLDSQALWYELAAAAPQQVREQVNAARVGVDFFVCLLYGNLLVAVAACGSLLAERPHYVVLLATAAVLVSVIPLWYELAVVTTDDWALATRALVDIGRKPLAEALGLRIPQELSQERAMWRQYCQFVRRPYDDKLPSSKLDPFRVSEESTS